MDFRSEDCALPTEGRRLANRSLLIANIVLDSVVRSCSILAGKPLPEPDVFDNVDKYQQAIDESYVPSEACVYLHTHQESY